MLETFPTHVHLRSLDGLVELWLAWARSAGLKRESEDTHLVCCHVAFLMVQGKPQWRISISYLHACRPPTSYHCLCYSYHNMNAINLYSSRSPLKVLLCTLLISCATFRSSYAFTTPPSAAVRHNSIQSSTIAASSSLSSASPDTAVNELDWDKVTDEWELDCYSRPVLVDGKKKLWEILLTDSSGNMRIRRALPSNKVNSREVRRVVEEIIDESEVKPSTIRFFRGAMFNMVRVY